MRRTPLLPTALLAAALAAGLVVATFAVVGGLAPSSVATAGPGDAPRVAVVDIFTLLNKSPTKAQIEAKRKADVAGIDTLVEEQAKKIRGLREQLAVLTRSDPQRPAIEENLARTNATAEFEVKWRRAKADEDFAAALERLYGEIRGAVRVVATARGYALVLAKTDDALNIDRTAEFNLSVAVRPVVYADRAVDITDAVAEWLAQQGRPPAPATPAPSVPPPPPSSPSRPGGN